jgi:tetratricopeptide (TPR) repeat protein
MEIGLCYEATGSIEEGLHFIKKAVNLSPDDLEYLYIQTKIHYKTGLYNEAELGYKKLIKLGCESPIIWMEYAHLMKKLNETKEAISLLKKGLEHNKNHSELLVRLGAYLFLDGQEDMARKYLHMANTINPEINIQLFNHIPSLQNNDDFNKLLNFK